MPMLGPASPARNPHRRHRTAADEGPPSKPLERPGHAFTLIELLVVISIIALLIAIVLPALQSAKQSARSVECKSNLRQIATGWVAYQTDHQRTMPAGDYKNYDKGFKYWWAGSDANGEMYPEDGVLSDYIPYESVEGCPAWDRFGKDREAKYWGHTNYGYNWSYFPGPGMNYYDFQPNNLPSVARIKEPARTLTFADSTRMNNPGEFQPTGWIGSPQSADPDYFHGRHSSRGNVAWADGHVSDRSPAHLDAGSISRSAQKRYEVGYVDRDGKAETDELYDLQ